VLDDARHRLEPKVLELARKWQVTPDCLVYDKPGLGRSFGSYLASHGYDGAIGSAPAAAASSPSTAARPTRLP
jgi:hypothetical protein